MNEIITLTKRHMKNYLRDKTSVFFSFLSVIILLAIYLLFLGKQFSDLPNLTAAENAFFAIGYIMGGVIVVNTITLSMGVIGTYIADLEQRKVDGFFVTPLKRYKLIVSYYLSTVIVTLAFTLLMFLLVILYAGLTVGIWFSASSLLSLTATIILYVFISSPIIIFLATLIKTMNAFGALSSIVGTVIGFIAGIYIPLSMLDPVTQNVASLMPFSHMTIHLRNMLIGNDIISKLPAEAVENLSLQPLHIFNNYVPMNIILIASSALAVGLLIVSYLKMVKKHK